MAFKQAKYDLHKLLTLLNDKLNHRLHSASSPNMNYDEWLCSHKPFNWLAEFYQIIEGNGGFDVIIGNPPYVVYSANNFEYSVDGYTTIKARNLYAFCIERSLSLINKSAYLSMIVPISISNGSNYRAVRELLYQRGTTHYSHYAGDSHPSCLFTGVQQNLTIFVSSPLDHSTFTTNYIKFYTEERFKLYSTLSYCKVDSAIDGIFRFGNDLQRIIGKKVCNKRTISIWLIPNSKARMYFKNTSGAAYKPFFSKPPFFEVDGVQITSKTIDYLCFRTIKQANSAIAMFNSNLFNFLYYIVSDARHITPRETLGLFYVDEQIENDIDLHKLSRQLERDFHKNSTVVTYNKKNGITKYAQFNPRLSKPIMDEIDTVLARHYGFTDEELDFIINYDIKYRMGDELNNSEE